MTRDRKRSTSSRSRRATLTNDPLEVDANSSRSSSTRPFYAESGARSAHGHDLDRTGTRGHRHDVPCRNCAGTRDRTCGTIKPRPGDRRRSTAGGAPPIRRKPQRPRTSHKGSLRFWATTSSSRVVSRPERLGRFSHYERSPTTDRNRKRSTRQPSPTPRWKSSRRRRSRRGLGASRSSATRRRRLRVLRAGSSV